MTIGAIGAVGAFASSATLSDDAAFLAGEAHGGTLAVEQTAATKFAITGIDNLVPYNKANGTGGWKNSVIEIQNTGSLAGNATVTVGGTDANGCFEYKVNRRDGATAWWPLATDSGGDWGGPKVSSTKTFTIGELKAGEKREYRIGLRMLGTCTTGGGLNSGGVEALESRHKDHAKATLNVTFDIKQLDQA